MANLVKVEPVRTNDFPHTEKLLKQCHGVRFSDLFVIDKKYDFEEIHELIQDTLNPVH